MVSMPVRSAITAASPICMVLAIFRPQKLHRLAFVENRLPVRSDQFDGVQRHAGLLHRLREQFAQQKIEPRDRAGVRRRVGNRKNGRPHFRRIRNGSRRDYVNAIANIDHRDVDAIHRRSADQACDPH